MTRGRTLMAMEFLTPAGARLELDRDGWRLVKPRSLGERELVQARVVLEQAESCVPPQDDPTAEPPTVEELGTYVAKQLGLRITHHRWKQHH